jgi:hypothetical protein
MILIINKYHIIKELKTQVNNFTAPSTFMASEAKKFCILYPAQKRRQKDQVLVGDGLKTKKVTILIHPLLKV